MQLLSIRATGLPDGVSVTLTGSSVVNGQLVLNVDTERNSAASTVNALPTFTLLSGGSELTSFWWSAWL